MNCSDANITIIFISPNFFSRYPYIFRTALLFLYFRPTGKNSAVFLPEGLFFCAAGRNSAFFLPACARLSYAKAILAYDTL